MQSFKLFLITIFCFLTPLAILVLTPIVLAIQYSNAYLLFLYIISWLPASIFYQIMWWILQLIPDDL